MVFKPAALDGVWLVQLEPRIDERGYFARTYCAEEFSRHGLNIDWPQGNVTRTNRRGTIRGMHWQASPKPEVKLVRCAAGRIWDVMVDVRPSSPTWGRWLGFELDATCGLQLYIPGGVAHGFQCLEDGSEVSYMMSEYYFPELARGLRWNDPEVGIRWPLSDPFLSARDQQLPSLSDLLTDGPWQPN